jgi:hypothetical protein
MKNKIHTLILFSILILSPSLTWAESLLMAEPDIETRMDWDLANDGRLFVSYDLDRDGRVDFCSWRIVTTSYFSKELPDEVAENNSGRLVFTVKYTESAYYYIAIKEPMLYAIDENQDGLWDVIYSDPMEDGVNGNETLHFRRAGSNAPIPNS